MLHLGGVWWVLCRKIAKDRWQFGCVNRQNSVFDHKIGAMLVILAACQIPAKMRVPETAANANLKREICTVGHTATWIFCDRHTEKTGVRRDVP